MQRITGFILASVLIAGCSSFSPQQEDVAPLTILHWNDFHAHNIPYQVTITDSVTGQKTTYKVGGTGNLIGYLNALGRGRPDVAVLNAGDDFQGTPVSAITHGRSQIELMNMIDPDVMELGNHEFDYGIDTLTKDLSLARFSVIGANLYDNGERKTFVSPATVKEYGPVRVGIIGLLPPDLPILTLKQNLTGTHMLDVDSVVDYQAKRLKTIYKVDLLLVLSHMGFGPDTLLAARHHDIDIIVGGHSHAALFKPLKKERTLIVQAGSYGRYVGRLDLIVDLDGDSVLSYTGGLTETKLGVYPIDSAAAQKAEEFEDLVNRDLNSVIGTLTVEWKRNFNEESNVGNWEADVMRKYAGADIALMNSGGLRKDLQPGPVTKRDIWEMNPFGNTLVMFPMTGDSVLKMIEWQAARKGEFMQVSGLRYSFDPGKPSGSKVVEATVDGKPVERDAQYCVVTNNYVFGHAPELLGIDIDPSVAGTLPGIDRDIIIDHIREHPEIHSTVEGRVTRTNSK